MASGAYLSLICYFLKEFFTSKFSYCGWSALLTLGFSGNPALLLMFCIVSHYCHVFESNKYLLRQNRMSFTALLLSFVLMGMRSDGPKSSHDHPCSNLEIIRNISTLWPRHSSRIRFLRFFFKIQKATFYVFEVSCQKNVKNVESVVQVFTFVHFEIANDFHCKTTTHMSCYTYNIRPILKLFILVKI